MLWSGSFRVAGAPRGKWQQVLRESPPRDRRHPDAIPSCVLSSIITLLRLRCAQLDLDPPRVVLQLSVPPGTSTTPMEDGKDSNSGDQIGDTATPPMEDDNGSGDKIGDNVGDGSKSQAAEADGTVLVDVDVTLSAYANARAMYEAKKK